MTVVDQAPESTPSPPLPTELLLVEDSAADARLVREMLRTLEAPTLVKRVASLGAAMQVLTEQDYDVVLLDLGLPDASPDEVIETMSTSASPHCAVVAVTGYDDKDLADALWRGDGEDYLVKGRFDAERLGQVLRRAVSRSRQRTQERRVHASLNVGTRRLTASRLAQHVSDGVTPGHTQAGAGLARAIHILESISGQAESLEPALSELRHQLEHVRAGLASARLAVSEVTDHFRLQRDRSARCVPRSAVRWAATSVRHLLPEGTRFKLDLRETGPVEASEDRVAQIAMSLFRSAVEGQPTDSEHPLCFEVLLHQDDRDVILVIYGPTGQLAQRQWARAQRMPHFNPAGLGLFGIARCLRDIGGTLQVRSKPGVGTQLGARLPRAD